MPQETCRQFLEIPTFLPWLIKRLRAQGMDYNKASHPSGLLPLHKAVAYCDHGEVHDTSL